MNTRHPAETRPFATWLAEQRNGALNDELTAALEEVVGSVTLLGRKGSVTLKIDVKPQAPGVLVITDDVAVKPPKEDRQGAVWFVDGDSNLSRTNQAQPSLEFEDDGGTE